MQKLLGAFAVVALTLVVASSANAATFTRDLTIGSTGSDVVALQDVLIAGNYLVMPAGVSKGYFGALTKSAVMKWQAAVGITPAAGYFGPISKAKVEGSTTGGSTTGGSTGSTSLKGGAGSIDEADFVGSINNEEVGEGEEDVEVLGLAIKPENSDINLTAVKVVFDKFNNTGSTRLNKYVDEVSVMLDGEEVAREDASDFKKDSTGVYSKTISLDKAVIEDGEVGKLTVAVTGVSNIDSVDATQIWDVEVESVRFEDAQGAIITESVTGDIGDTRDFTVEEFATSADIKFKLQSGDSSINNSRTIKVSSTTKTTDESVLSFKIKLEGDSDVNLDEVRVAATTTGATLQNVITAAYLIIDGDEVGSENINVASTSITFDDLDLDLSAGETYDAEVRVDFAKATGSFLSGTTIDVDATSTANWVIEDENGDTLVAADRSGSASADAHKLVTSGLQISSKVLTAEAKTVGQNASTTYGNYQVEVTLTAIGDTVYVLETAASSSVASTTAGISFVFEDSTNAQIGNVGVVSSSFKRTSGGTIDGSSIRIDEDGNAKFTLTATLDPNTAGQYQVRVVGAGFGSSNAGTGSSIVATPVNDFRTTSVFIAN